MKNLKRKCSLCTSCFVPADYFWAPLNRAAAVLGQDIKCFVRMMAVPSISVQQKLIGASELSPTSQRLRLWTETRDLHDLIAGSDTSSSLP